MAPSESEVRLSSFIPYVIYKDSNVHFGCESSDIKKRLPLYQTFLTNSENALKHISVINLAKAIMNLQNFVLQI